MATISRPEDTDAAVKELPAEQKPFDDPCGLDRQVQAVCYHYELSQKVVDLMVQEGFTSIRMIRAANPDSGEDDLYDAAMEAQLEELKVTRLQRLLAKRAFRRMCRPKPFDAVSVVDDPPASKRSRTSANKSTSATSGSSSSAPAKPGSSSAAAAASAAASAAAPAAAVAESSTSRTDAGTAGDSSSSSDVEVLDDESAEDPVPVSSKRRDLVSLLDDVGNEVRVCLFCFLFFLVFFWCFVF